VSTITTETDADVMERYESMVPGASAGDEK